MKRLLRQLSAVAAVSIIGFALLTLAARAALTQADTYRSVVAGKLGQFLGVDVEVGRLRAHLRGFSPVLSFDDAALRDPDTGERLLAVRALRVDLDLAATLRALEPRIDGVTLVGADLALTREPDGRIGVHGLDGVRGGDGGALTFFLREGRFSLTGSRVRWRADAEAAHVTGPPPTPLVLDVQRLDVVNRRGRHRLTALLGTPGADDVRLRLRADLVGPARQPDTWSGEVYADWSGGNLDDMLAARLPPHLGVSNRSLQAATWSRIERGRLAESLMRLRIGALAMHREGDGRSLHLADVSALARWRPIDGGWRLQVADLRFGPQAGPRPTTDLRLDYMAPAAGALAGRGSAEAGGGALVGAVEALPLASVAAITELAGASRLPAVLRALLQEGVDGHARDIAFRAGLSAGRLDPQAWSLAASLHGLGFASAGAIPEVRGLSVDFSVSPRGGRARLRGSDVHLDLRPHLVAPLTLTALEGAIGWRIMPAGSVSLWTDALRADTNDLQSVSRFRICAHSSGAAPFVDLHAFFRDGDAEAMGRYLPVSIMDDRLEEWLSRAVVAGRLDSGDVLLRGSLDDFPFDDNEGRFLVELRVRDGILDYWPPGSGSGSGAGAEGMRSASSTDSPGWPRLESLDLTLRFENRRMTIDVEQGKLLDSEVLAGSVLLPDIWNPRRLAIEARGEGPLSDGLRVLAETPLSAKLGGVARAFRVEGRGDIALQLGVPLRRGLDFTYAGQLRFDGAPAAELPAAGLRFEDLDGMLAFDGEGLRAEGIVADLAGQRLRVDVATRDGGTGRARTEIGIGGRTTAAELARGLPDSVRGTVEGRVDWRLLLSLNNADADRAAPPLDLLLSSDLTGLAVGLPAPLGKSADEARPLTLSARWENAWPLAVRGRYGDLGALIELERGEGRAPAAVRVAVDPGAMPESLPDRPGIRVDGALATLDLPPWLEWLSAHFASDGAAGEAVAGSRPAQVPTAPGLLPSRLAVADLRVGPLELRNAVAEVSRAGDAGGWAIRFKSESTGGSVDLPAGGAEAPVEVRLDALDIEPLLPAESGTDSARAAARGDPRRLGKVVLAVNNLRYGDDDLGRLQLRTQPIAGGVRVADLSLTGELVQAEGSLDWTVDGTDYMQTTLDLSGSSTDVGGLLRRLGRYSQLSGAPSDARLALTWPGAPGDFSLRRARGSLAIDVGAGRLLELDAGVGRLLGVLNIAALQRRLSLDFSDVFEEGFSFDRIDGRLTVGGGTARIETLDILASAADIRVGGVTNLADETFDQTVRVTPKIGTGVALASAVAGGPLVGAAVFIADKVAGDAVDRIGRYEYSITGPWNDPEIRRTASADGSWSVGDLFTEDTPAAGRDTAASPAASEKPKPADNPFLEGF